MNTNLYSFRIQKRAFTLVELLVVMAVISLLAALSLPALRNTIREQKVVRGANSLTSFFKVAQARAISNGRPYGVVIERLGQQTGVQEDWFRSIRIQYCSSPFVYSGDDGDARARVVVAATRQSDGNFYGLVEYGNSTRSAYAVNVSLLTHAAEVHVGGSTDETSAIQVGDTVFLAGTDFPLQVSSFSTNNGNPRTQLKVPADAVASFNRQIDSLVSFRVEPAPSATSDSAFELNDGVSIDLSVSGIGRGGDDFSPFARLGSYDPSTFSVTTDLQPIMIVFGSDGAIDHVRIGDNFLNLLVSPAVTSFGLVRREPTSDIHLCVARSEEIRPDDILPATPPNDGLPSLLSGESSWVSIGLRSGEVKVDPAATLTPAEVATVTSSYSGTSWQAAIQAATALSRKFAVGVE